MAELPADLRLRRELIAKLACVLEAQMRRDALTLRQAAEMLEVSHPRIADLLARRGRTRPAAGRTERASARYASRNAARESA